SAAGGRYADRPAGTDRGGRREAHRAALAVGAARPGEGIGARFLDDPDAECGGAGLARRLWPPPPPASLVPLPRQRWTIAVARSRLPYPPVRSGGGGPAKPVEGAATSPELYRQSSSASCSGGMIASRRTAALSSSRSSGRLRRWSPSG